jgi:hypothetical protein
MQAIKPAQQDRPIDRFLALLKGPKEYTPAGKMNQNYTAHCPSHHDGKRSLMVWEDDADGHVGVKCFAGCSRTAIVESVGLTEQDLYIQDEGKRRNATRKKSLDICELLIDKLILPVVLESFGVRNGSCTYHKNGKEITRAGVVIPYFTEDGQPYERYRLRTSLIAKEGSYWNESGAPMIPYGLQRLQDARNQGYLVIVEGESDCWTLWQHGYPALGIPGANNDSTLQHANLAGIPKVFIIQEPDGAGQAFPDKVQKRLKDASYTGKVYKVNLSEFGGAKDPNDLQKRDPRNFKQTFQTALDRAVPMFPVTPKPEVYRLCDLQDEVLPDVKWAIPDILPEGLTWLCGKPKLGKSWLLLSMLLSVASGGVVMGNIPVEAGEVLYISLEDNKRRLQKRTNKVLNQLKASPNFYYTTTWPRLNEGGLEALEEWIQEHPNVRLIGIDTWGKIKPRSKGSQKPLYDEDYDALAPIQELAGRYGISIVLVHHMRKQESEDPIDSVSGSVAMAGAVDGFLLLYRKRGEEDARLYVTGRDIEEEQEIMLSFSPECASWTIKGDAEEYAGTPERQAILDLLACAPNGLRAREMADQLKKNYNTLRNLLVKLRSEGKITLKNDVYSVVSRSQRSQCPQGKYENTGEKRNGAYDYADYGNDGSVVSHSQPEYEHATSDYATASPDYADYANTPTVVSRSQVANQPEKRDEETADDPLTTLTTADYGDYYSQPEGDEPPIRITYEPLDIKKAAREYELLRDQGWRKNTKNKNGA